MLKYLHIENIAVIEKTDIDFTDGFNVLTGETGAGKSIIIDAINAVLGERTSKELIRAGCERAEVSALFGNLSVDSTRLLEENGFFPDEDGNLLVTRVLSHSGSGSIKINGKPVTAGMLRLFSESLVNIHGQHDNQGLLNPDNHYLYVDLLAENDAVLSAYYSEFKHLNSVRRELNLLECDEEEKRRKIELLGYQINELRFADVKIGEVEVLKKNLEISENYLKTLNSYNTAYNLINGTDDADGAMAMISNAKKSLESVKTTDSEGIVSKILNILTQLDDVNQDIRSFTQNTDYAVLDTNDISQRLDELYRLMLKYGDSEEKLHDFLASAESELEQITLSDKRTEELSNELDMSTERLVEIAEKLTSTRKIAAKTFENDVTEVLKYLDMPNVTFKVNIDNGRYTKFGCDVVEFFIGTNLGEALKPLSKIASGGELSRIMLATKSVLAKKDNVDTLIFDEIDSGISGRAAGKVGVRLKGVSKDRQVVCVTHLAQIAAFADNHLLIEKRTDDKRTYTGVKSLSYSERIQEIARIMSGTEITENLFNSAKELLDRSLNDENL